MGEAYDRTLAERLSARVAYLAGASAVAALLITALIRVGFDLPLVPTAADPAPTFVVVAPTPKPPPPAEPVTQQQRPAPRVLDPLPAEETTVEIVTDFELATEPSLLGPSDGSAATGTVAPPGPPLITKPRWTRVPSGAELARFYPQRALDRGREGAVMLDCRVSTSGALACSILSEQPAGWGFGRAALEIAASYRMEPATRDGAPVEGRYVMQVPFELN